MITMEQIRAGRAILNWKQQDLAKKAGVSIGTLNNIERGVQTDPKLSTIRAIQRALELEGIQFVEAESGSYGVHFKLRRSGNAEIPLLIIDDSDTDRKLYKTWLNKQQEKKFKIIEASNARDGYEAFIKASPACIILDFVMYGKDGFQLLIEMKKDNVPLPPIIFVTAMHSENVKKDVSALGVAAYLDKKDLTPEKLCAAVIKALA